MRIVFFCIGGIAVVCGIGLVVATTLAKLTPLTGYSGGLSVVLGGAACLLAGTKNYREHWSFVTGVVLVTLAFAAVGGEIDDYRLRQGTSQDLAFGFFLDVMFLTFGVLSLWSSQKLHRCVVALEQHQETAN